MDGGARSLDGATELERQDAQNQTQQGDGQPYLGHQQEPKGVLEEKIREVCRRVTEIAT